MRGFPGATVEVAGKLAAVAVELAAVAVELAVVAVELCVEELVAPHPPAPIATTIATASRAVTYRHRVVITGRGGHTRTMIGR
jgi:hypothetical protein